VIDFEASGGTNGATKPFPGTLKIDDTVVRAGSDSKASGHWESLGGMVAEQAPGFSVLSTTASA